MRIGVRRETADGERRVALVPESVKRLRERGLEVGVETRAGAGAWLSDEEYRAAGAIVEAQPEALWGGVDLVVKVHPPSPAEALLLRAGAGVVSFLYPATNARLIETLAARGVTAIAVDALPRIALAQAMDALSSQSTAAGYRAVLLAAHALPRFLPMLMTAAGTVPPARFLVLGAGVAGLQAIAVARRLGAVVEAFDVRRAAKEQVESLGARFVEAGLEEDAEATGGYAHEVSPESGRRAAAAIGERLVRTDACISTAQVPGRPAPRLISGAMVEAMRPGSVIVDLAAEQGGNCELTEPGRTVVRHGVTIIGAVHAASDVAVHASQMYSRNVERLVLHLVRDGALVVDLGDAITRATLATHQGQVLLPAAAPAPPPGPRAAALPGRAGP
jgi:NAD(P) transhydrogenase subunit alpha